MPYEIQAIRAAYEGWCRLLVATIRMPDGQTIKREIEEHGDAIAVLPYDPDRGVAMLVRQFRPPVFHAAGQAETLEAPAGLLDEDDPETCAQREAFEEVGLRLSALAPVMTSWSMPGVSCERIHLFLAPYSAADRTDAGGGVEGEHENITPAEVALNELATLADSGRLPDMKTFALVQTLRLRHPHLFQPREG
ncbi:MAG TPA: NUDIX hydrolase [Enterovirga sp.]|nr:NUDIX hydrolase [Enterovirga sp.]